MVNSIGSKLKIYNVNTGQKFEGVVVRNGSNFMQISARNTNTGLSLGMISMKKDEINNLDEMPSAIITVNYNGIMFALTMETHVGIVTINSTSNYKIAEASESENTSDLLKDIVWYEEQNLFIFSPEKISMLVFSELKNQIAVRTEEDLSLIHI